MAMITIDGKEYEFDDLSEEIKAQIVSIQAVDRRLTLCQEESAILQTARMSYMNALKDYMSVVQ